MVTEIDNREDRARDVSGAGVGGGAGASLNGLLDTLSSGTGPDTVLLIHSSGMSAAQWLRHVAILGRQHRVIAPHLLGYGKSPRWDPSRVTADVDDLAALRELVDELDGPLHLVGHSYGGTLAVRLALELPSRFSTLALLEPVLVGLLRDDVGAAAMQEISLEALQGLEPGSEPWLTAFVNYWSGDGAFQKMAPSLRAAFIAAGPKVAGEVIGISADERGPEAYRGLTMPALCAHGELTTLAGKEMTERLANALPNAELKILRGAGHMAAVTKAAEVCELLERLFTQDQLG